MTQPAMMTGKQIIDKLVRQFWDQTDQHASGVQVMGNGARMPSMTAAQAKLNLQAAINQAFCEGAAYQAQLQPPTPIEIIIPVEGVTYQEGRS